MEKTKLTPDQPFEGTFSLQQISDTDELQMNHVRLKSHSDLPAHNTNSNVRLLVLNGAITLTVNGEEEVLNPRETAAIPYQTPMQIRNLGDQEAEFIVIKTPNPRVLEG